MKRKIILDCDPGMDEAFAMAYAAADPEAFELLAVTVEGSLYPVDTAAENAVKLVDFFGLDTTVAKGMAEPLVGEALHPDNGFFARMDLPPGGHMETEPAVLFLNGLLDKIPQGEKVTIVCTGPATNIALLLKLFPDKKEKIEEILFAGGGVCAGNVTPSAEYNVYADPEAARILLRLGLPMTICSLDAVLDCSLKRNQILKMCQSGHRYVKTLGDLAGAVLENTGEKYRGMVGIQAAVPFMFLSHPEDFTGKRAILDVDLSEGPGRGALLCDFRWWTYDAEDLNTTILLKAEGSRFQEHLITALYELGETMEK